MAEEQTGLAIFEGKQIRRTWHEGEWWFAVADIVELLSESKDVKQYIKKMRSRDPELGDKWGTICTPLAMEAADGRIRRINASNMEGMFRIIQSINSPKAEPFKQWLAEVGKQRLDELAEPELAIERMKEDYRKLGYDDEWINRRLQSIDIRKLLTEEWKKRGVKEGREFSILTAEISRGTFGMTPGDHKTYKGLKRENLRDHMTNLELIFTMLGEEETKQEAVDRDAQGFNQNRDAAREGGQAAGDAREAFELRSGRKVLSQQNRKDQIKAAKEQARIEAKKKDDR
jgi:hypothetical protein